MKNKQRNIYIDILKGLLMVFVVIGHLPYFEYDSRTLTLIYSFHMPAFLIIGGMLSHVNENSSFFDVVKKRFVGAIVPYFVFYFISLVFMPVTSLELRAESILTVFKGIGIPANAVNLPLWFLTFYFCAMTVFELIYVVVCKLCIRFDERIKLWKIGRDELVYVIDGVIVLILMIMSFTYSKIYRGARLYFNFEIAVFCLGFVFLGKVIGVIWKNGIIEKFIQNKKLSKVVLIVMLVLIVIVWYILSMKNGRIDLNARDYKNALFMYIDAILGFGIVLGMGFFIYKLPVLDKVFAYLGKNSLYILAYHVPSVLIIQNLIVPVLPVNVAALLSHNSIMSIVIMSGLQIFISLFFGAIHKSSGR